LNEPTMYSPPYPSCSCKIEDFDHSSRCPDPHYRRCKSSSTRTAPPHQYRRGMVGSSDQRSSSLVPRHSQRANIKIPPVRIIICTPSSMAGITNLWKVELIWATHQWSYLKRQSIPPTFTNHDTGYTSRTVLSFGPIVMKPGSSEIKTYMAIINKPKILLESIASSTVFHLCMISETNCSQTRLRFAVSFRP
jgi:hypothetical protein